MSSRTPARNSARRARSTVPAAVVLASAVVIGALCSQSLALSPRSVASGPPLVSSAPSAPPARRPTDHGPGDHHGALGEADGVVADGVTVFAPETPAVANLDPILLGALRRAATDAAGDGVTFYVTSGWRSAAYQEQLRRDAIAKYGSEAAASRWVATPTTSAHVSGKAVDIGSSDATAWLARHGAEHGLCQIYRNEPWHYELRPDAVHRGCPPMYADPTQDPRMQP